MRSFKPEMDIRLAETLLQQVMNSPVSNVRPIEQGELSKVFSFSLNDKELIVHFNNKGDGFEKERYIYEAFRSQGITVPVPRIVEIGRANDLFYSIAEKAPGRPISSFLHNEIMQIVPDLIAQFTQINRLQLAATTGYGWIQPSGDGLFNSWTEFLESFFLEEQTGFWDGWYRLFDESFLERDVFDHLYAVMLDMASYSPQERYLVHGDFHLGNMLTDGLSVTGIVDWEMALYGDFMFDLATQLLWSPQLQFPQRVREAWAADNQGIPHFDERLRCALLFKGLDSLRFFAKQDHRNAYDSVKQRLLALIEPN